MSQRLRPGQRIRKRKTFEILFKKGRFARGKLLNLWAYPGDEFEGGKAGPKIGIIVSRKVHLRATKRNLWKRRIREAFRRMQERIKQNKAVMIQARRQEKVPTYKEIFEEIESLLKKAGCFNQ